MPLLKEESDRIVINRTSIISRAPDYYSEFLDDSELIVLSASGNSFVSLTGSSLSIWNAIESPLPMEDLLNNLGQIYAVDINDIEKDVVEFIHDMLAKDIVDAVSSSGVKTSG